MRNQLGLSLIETTVTVAVLGALAVIANVGYQTHIAKSQTSEAMSLMASQKAVLIEHLGKNMNCDVDPKVFKGKYGELSISGDPEPLALSHGRVLLKTGCTLTYTFGSEGVSSKLKGKVISADLFNNGVLSKGNATNVDSGLISKHLTKLTEDEKPKIVVQEPEAESGIGGENGGASVDGDREIEAIDTRPQGQICTEKFTVSSDTTVIAIDSSAKYKTEQDDNYHVRDGVNLKDLFVQQTGRQPVAGDKVHYYVTCATAIVSHEHEKPAIKVGDWPDGVELKLNNYGAVLGRGGDTADWLIINNEFPSYLISPDFKRLFPSAFKETLGRVYNFSFKLPNYREDLSFRYSIKLDHPAYLALKDAKFPGDAVVNEAAQFLRINNYAVIAGGGGFGRELREKFYKDDGSDRFDCGSQFIRPGAGAPYGRGGLNYELINGQAVRFADVTHYGYSSVNATFKQFSRGGGAAEHVNGGRGHHCNGVYVGNGGGWGESGGSSTAHWLNNIPPGYYKKGNVEIQNIGTGWTKGRSI